MYTLLYSLNKILHPGLTMLPQDRQMHNKAKHPTWKIPSWPGESKRVQEYYRLLLSFWLSSRG